MTVTGKTRRNDSCIAKQFPASNLKLVSSFWEDGIWAFLNT